MKDILLSDFKKASDRLSINHDKFETSLTMLTDSGVMSNYSDFPQIVQKKWWLKSDHLMSPFITF
jgi:hypothetical protein